MDSTEDSNCPATDDTGSVEDSPHESKVTEREPKIGEPKPSSTKVRKRSNNHQNDNAKKQKTTRTKILKKPASDDSDDEGGLVIDENRNSASESQEKPEKSSDSVPLVDDPRLPSGWTRKLTQRKVGRSAGKFDVYIFSPDGKKFRSRFELSRHLANINSTLDIELFDFSVRGTGHSSPVQAVLEKKPPKPASKKRAEAAKAAPSKKVSSEELASDTKKASRKVAGKKSASKSGSKRLVVKLNFSPKKRMVDDEDPAIGPDNSSSVPEEPKPASKKKQTKKKSKSSSKSKRKR